MEDFTSAIESSKDNQRETRLRILTRPSMLPLSLYWRT
jgi:hypothetical protein